MDNLIKWAVCELSSILQFPVTEDMAQCIVMIESNRDLEEYLKTLLDLKKPTHQKFMKELKQKKQMLLGTNVQGYKKAELDNYIQSRPQDKRKKGNKNKQEIKKTEAPEDHPHSSKHKNRFVNILNTEIRDSVLLKGRHICNCQASKHSLINNCLKCGRIVCAQEGPGPCFFCGNPIYSREEGKSYTYPKYSQNIPEELNSSLESAIELRDRLLEYDKSSESRTTVIDDESDYFSSTSVWLNKEQRDEFKSKIEELQDLKNSRGQKKLCVDFMGRYIIEDDSLAKSFQQEDLILQELTDIFSKSTIGGDNTTDPNSTIDIHPIYYSSAEQQIGAKWHNIIGRVQDKEVMEMTDSGMCLSMHQPWASLLVYGIKEHEGRNWYTSHRGRLWIASASKVPTQEEIKLVEDQYRFRGENIKFPNRYPVGCLLGCVQVVDCLAQEDYKEKYQESESDSPFVFICTNPIKCSVMFPIQGKHKIYKLDPKIHQAAVKCIQKVANVQKDS